MKTPKDRKECTNLLVRLMKSGLSQRAVAYKLTELGWPMNQSSVSRTWRKWQAENGATSLQVRQSTKTLSRRNVSFLKRRATAADHPSLRQLQGQLQEVGKTASKSTICREFHQDPNIICKRPVKGMYLSKAHRQARKEFAHAHLQANTDWNKVVFTDEKLFCLDGPGWRPKVWQDKRLPPVRLPTKGKRNATVCVWGCFSVDGIMELRFVSSHANSESYCQTLASVTIPPDFTLFLDRDPAHRSRHTQQWMEAHRVRAVFLPAKGADMNPIEHVWAGMSKKVYGSVKTYTSTAKLRNAIEAAWAEAVGNKEERRKLIGSMPNRLQAVVDRKGDLTSY